MVNIRAIGQKFTKSEAKELLDDAKKLIDDKVLGENFKRESLIKKKKLKRKLKLMVKKEKLSMVSWYNC